MLTSPNSINRNKNSNSTKKEFRSSDYMNVSGKMLHNFEIPDVYISWSSTIKGLIPDKI